MPMYDFQCQHCGHAFEALVRSSSPLPPCPACASTEVGRQVSAPVAPGKSKAIIASNRRLAAAQGHFSNYDPGERARLLKG